MENTVRNLNAPCWLRLSIISLVLTMLSLSGSLGTAVAQTALQNPDSRTYQSLDGAWSYIIDPYSTGDTDILGSPKADGYFLDLQSQGPADLLEYDFELAPKLNVPGSWTSQVEEIEYYEGIVWHRTRFQAAPDPDKRYFIQFEAVNYRADVFVNGALLGSHEGGFTPFAIEVTEALVAGDNSLVVRVESERRTDRVPGIRMDWLNYAGITRSVRLIEVPPTYVKNYSLKLADPATRQINVTVDVDGVVEQDVTVSIPELGLSRTISVSADGPQAFSLFADCLTLWSPENPKLYRVEISTSAETITDDIGFRVFSSAGRRLLLNGRPLYILGISVHDERLGPNGGRIQTREQAGALLDKVQAMDANFIRLAHYPHNEYMLQEADRRGLMVWSELPVYWGIDWSNPQTLESAKLQYSEMIARDVNRASILVWSIANETVNTSERLSFLKSLSDHVRSLDDSRMIAAALLPDYSDAAIAKMVSKVTSIINGNPAEEHYVTVDDPLGEYIDLVALNQYYGWYYSRPVAAAINRPVGEVRAAFLKLIPSLRFDNVFEKPMIISEYGAGAVQGRRGNPDVIWTEDFQKRLYNAQLGMMIGNPNLQGITPWVFKDFRSPMRPLVGAQDGWNRKGVISETGDQKLAFDVLKFAYRAYGTSLSQALPPAPVCEADQ